MKTDTMTPKNRYSRRGTMMNHMNDEINNARSHKNEENISKIVFIAESEMVKMNIASGAPKARKAQPKNSATVIVTAGHTI